MIRTIIIGVAIVIGVVGLFALVTRSTEEKATETDSPSGTTEEITEVIDKNTKYTISEVAQHSTEDDCWVIIDQVVYNLTTFVKDHPGGPVILSVCGKDGTEAFKNQGVPPDVADDIREQNDLPSDTEFHSPNAREILDSLKIGMLAT